jgi:WhiB family redox-sensing transcriptional regulator
MSMTNEQLRIAACRDVDPETFFVSGSESAQANKAQVAKAKRVCATCLVRTACLDDAIESGQDVGIFGGLTPDERRGHKRYTRAVASR